MKSGKFHFRSHVSSSSREEERKGKEEEEEGGRKNLATLELHSSMVAGASDSPCITFCQLEGILSSKPSTGVFQEIISSLIDTYIYDVNSASEIVLLCSTQPSQLFSVTLME